MPGLRAKRAERVSAAKSLVDDLHACSALQPENYHLSVQLARAYLILRDAQLFSKGHQVIDPAHRSCINYERAFRALGIENVPRSVRLEYASALLADLRYEEAHKQFRKRGATTDPDLTVHALMAACFATGKVDSASLAQVTSTSKLTPISQLYAAVLFGKLHEQRRDPVERDSLEEKACAFLETLIRHDPGAVELIDSVKLSWFPSLRTTDRFRGLIERRSPVSRLP
jgi:hypothetical protein